MANPNGPWRTYSEFRSANRTELPPLWTPGTIAKVASDLPRGDGHTFLYRGVDPQYREQIQREGMHPNPDDGYLFMTDDPEYAHSYGGDLWRVDTTGLDAWENDPEYHNWMVQDTHVPPERLTLVRSAS